MNLPKNRSKKSRKGCCSSCLIVCVIALVALVALTYFGARPVIEAAKSGNPTQIVTSLIKEAEKHLPADQMDELLNLVDESGKLQFTLAEYYEQGESVEKNEAEAKKWYGKAAKKGYAPAAEALERLGASPAPASSEPAPTTAPADSEPKAEEAAPKAEATE